MEIDKILQKIIKFIGLNIPRHSVCTKEWTPCKKKIEVLENPDNNNNIPNETPTSGVWEVKHTQTLPLPREIVSHRPLAQGKAVK